MIRNLLLILAALVLASPTNTAGADDLYQYPRGTTALEGVIIKVVSAGEMVLWEKGKLYPFNLYGISLPAPQSPEGQAAKKKVSDMVFNTLLRVHLLPDESLGARGVVIIRGECLNKTLVRMGLAGVDASCRMPEFCGTWKEARKRAETKPRGIRISRD